jgi:hypothetical protein
MYDTKNHSHVCDSYIHAHVSLHNGYNHTIFDNAYEMLILGNKEIETGSSIPDKKNNNHKLSSEFERYAIEIQ